MRRTADVVIIGGGIQGASIAWHLARRGATDVVLLEKETLASGCSGRTGGMIRQHYSTDLVTVIAKQGRGFFSTLRGVVGGAFRLVHGRFRYPVDGKDAGGLASHRRARPEDRRADA